jgi:hypothetical protein
MLIFAASVTEQEFYTTLNRSRLDGLVFMKNAKIVQVEDYQKLYLEIIYLQQ